ncbi:radical SAM protein [Bacillus cereus]|uniref:Radical SAM core domain-containing protein n=1 Tax=Bacillus cereus HuA2-1 TaxID=1053201 RepID=J9BJF5_BACCE|nr:radical SAM protein [Bacillus cereus]EJV74130.1 hypothetical protein IG3_05952 [Bacillus cereus HuA2-1]
MRGNWYNKYRYLSHVDAIKDISKNNIVYPKMMEIDLTDYCNHNCIWCVDRSNRQKQMEVSLIEIYKLLESFKENGVKSIVLKGGGEPTTFKGFVEIVEKMKLLDFKIGLITNGAQLLDDSIRTVIGESCEWVRVSLDAATKELHDKLHRPQENATLPIVLDGTKKLATQYGDKVTIGFNYVFHSLNKHEIVKATLLAKNIGVKYISFRPEIPHKIIKKKDLIPQDIEDELNMAKLHENHTFKVLIASHGYINQENLTCKSHSLIGILRTDGEMTPCCFLKDDSSMFYGNVFKESFENVWEGEKRQQVIKKIENGECKHNCGRAGTDRARRYWEYNELIKYYEMENEGHFYFI